MICRMWLIMIGESCSVEKELESTRAINAVYQDKTNILFSVRTWLYKSEIGRIIGDETCFISFWYKVFYFLFLKQKTLLIDILKIYNKKSKQYSLEEL